MAANPTQMALARLGQGVPAPLILILALVVLQIGFLGPLTV